LTDTKGREVDNPVFEFDACFDPEGDTTATGVFEWVLNVASTSLLRRPDGTVDVQLVCGAGAHGCGGTIAASAGSTDLAASPTT
jgi:hypothetical protein